MADAKAKAPSTDLNARLVEPSVPKSSVHSMVTRASLIEYWTSC